MEENCYAGVIFSTIPINIGLTETMAKVNRAWIEWPHDLAT